MRQYNATRRRHPLTSDTLVGGLHVGDEILATRLRIEQVRIGYRHGAAAKSRAARVHGFGDIGRASDMVIDGYTSVVR